MRIFINTKNVTDDVDGVYLNETGANDDMPQKGYIQQYFNEATARMVLILGRYYMPMEMVDVDDTLAVGEAVCFEIALPSRKAAGKSQAFADLIHSFMVNSILTKIYSNRGQADLAQKHEAQTVSDADAINVLLHTKRPVIC